jgi:sulfur-carrier protein adenylyltransferase/sulfurtransferase
MASELKIPSPLRRFTGGDAAIQVNGKTIKEVLNELFTAHPDIKNHLIEENGTLRNFVNIFVNNEDIRHSGGLDSKVSDNSDVRIIPSIAGGVDNLTPPELTRYSRHITLPEVGIEGQKKLKSAKILVVGAGGLGCPIALYLAAAGVGTIGMVDYDVVDESNLQRQILYGVTQKGQPKLHAARERLQNLNPHIKINLHPTALTSVNALDIVKNYDIVLDGTDNFPTRYLVNDACVMTGKPNVYGSIYRFDGQVSVFNYEDGPCYRCLYPSPPPPGLVPSCAEGGVLGVLPGIIGCLQANEAIKLILGIGNLMKGRFMLFDALEMEFTELKVKKDPNCVVCGKNPSVTDLINYQEFCGIPNAKKKRKKFDEITVTELKKLLDKDIHPIVIDVREPFELDIAQIRGTIHIPMREIQNHLSEFNVDEEIIIHCKSGVRSAKICKFLIENKFTNVKNVTGGILAWSKEIDSSIPQY